MALRNIVLDGDPSLRKKSREVVNFDERLSILIEDMTETMRHADGVGIAAVQVGVLRRVVVIEIDDQLIELVNPEIICESEETECATEGCLSFPEKQVVVRRPNVVKVRAKDRTGKEVEYQGEGYLARAFCHELNHLDGIVFLDVKLSDEEVDQWIKEQEEKQAEDEQAAAESEK